ncbi:MAG: PRC-barrel domain-containing protein, partial [Planctomycetota bacterium]
NQSTPSTEVEGSQPEAALRSLKEIDGYSIQATDGDLGSVEDAIVDTRDWKLVFFVVDTRKWLPGRKVLVSPDWIESISWPDKKVFVTVTKDQVKNSPEFEPSEPVNDEYRDRLFDYYGRPVGRS